jgi:antitoxin component YwqK of YwqJK toxin-antitoxin module
MNDLKATTYPNEEKSYTYDLFNNKPCVKHYENGRKKIEINYKDGLGLIHGTWKCWYKSGQIKSTSEYQYNKRDGLCTSWYEGGQKSAEINYSKGVKNGRLILWHRDGGKKSEVVYSNGRMNSLWVGWDADGQIQKAVLFKGKRKVSKTTWHNNGRLKLQTNYESSRRALHELPETDWDSYPYNTIDMDIDFMTGKPIKINPYGVLETSEKLWYKNGNAKNEWANNGYHHVNIGWYENGQLKYNYGHDSPGVRWHENGQKSYEYGIKNGFDTAWDANGIKIYECKHIDFVVESDLSLSRYKFYKDGIKKICTINIKMNFDLEYSLYYFIDNKNDCIYKYKCPFENGLKPEDMWDYWISLKHDKLTTILTDIGKQRFLLC